MRFRAHSRRALAVVLLVVLVGGALTGCNPDPTGGARPPRPGTGAPYSSSQATATREDVSLSWREGCPVHWHDLTVVTVAYWGYDGTRHVGRLVVHDDVAGQVRLAFAYMYDHRFQVRRIHPVDRFGADDDKSMAANNTSAFNCRRVTGGTSWSQHSYGTAIDINPVQNPYIKGSTVLPPASRDWVDRRHVVPGMIVEGGPVVEVFDALGWGWGGRWRTLKDYQHVSHNGR
jgi:hypothetical protein